MSINNPALGPKQRLSLSVNLLVHNDKTLFTLPI